MCVGACVVACVKGTINILVSVAKLILAAGVSDSRVNENPERDKKRGSVSVGGESKCATIIQN